jgi:hypothetical protein
VAAKHTTTTTTRMIMTGSIVTSSGI